MSKNTKTIISLILTFFILAGYYFYHNCYIDNDKKIGLESYITFIKEINDKDLIKYNHIFTENDRKSIELQKVITIETKYSLLYKRELRQKEFYYYYENFAKNTNNYLSNVSLNFFNNKEIQLELNNSIIEFETYVDNMLNNPNNENAIKFKKQEILEEKARINEIRESLQPNVIQSNLKSNKSNLKESSKKTNK